MLLLHPSLFTYDFDIRAFGSRKNMLCIFTPNRYPPTTTFINRKTRMSPFSSWLKKIAEKLNRNSSDLVHLPSYEDSERSQIEYFFKQQSKMRISAKSVPQCLWTPEQCRVWLFSFMITCLSYSPADAVATAMKFEGFGATLYSKHRSYWIKLLGAWHGPGIELVIVGYSTKKGVLPGSMHLSL
jgi:hypothetical protein